MIAELMMIISSQKLTASILSLHLGIQSGPCEEQLVRLDEQCNEKTYKVGVMYCRAGQQTEEEMYNNEEGGPAFNEFLDLIGQRVRLKGFNKYKAGLCNKSKLLVHFQPARSVFLSPA